MQTDLETTLLHCRNLPSPPGVALRVIDIAKDPDASLEDIAKIISADPALSARLLRIANSPMYATRRRVSTLSQAIAAIGSNAILSLALGFSLINGFRGRDSVQAIHDKMWRRSVLSGLIARLLSQHLRIGKSENLMLAGLLQDIGRLALLQATAESYSAISTKATTNDELLDLERATYGSTHAEIGAWLAQRWNLPECLVEAIRESESDDARNPFVCCIQVSGIVADLWLTDEDPEHTLYSRAQQKVAQCCNGDMEALSTLLSQVAGALSEISSIFEVTINHPAHLQAIHEEARELLILRNLRQIQEMTQLRHDAHAMEERMRHLTEQSRRDPLTGVFNRLHLEEALEKDFAAAGQQYPLTIALIDLDHFKNINDQHGHLVGDQVLHQFAQTIQRSMRSSDMLARYGGEEFLLLLHFADEAAAEKVITRLLEDVSQLPMAVVGDTPIHVTFSAGIATHNGIHGAFDSAKALLHAADLALYKAKSEGRNRVLRHSR